MRTHRGLDIWTDPADVSAVELDCRPGRRVDVEIKLTEETGRANRRSPNVNDD